MSCYRVPWCKLGAFQLLSNLILITILWNKYYYHSHFTDNETGS